MGSGFSKSQAEGRAAAAANAPFIPIHSHWCDAQNRVLLVCGLWYCQTKSRATVELKIFGADGTQCDKEESLDVFREAIKAGKFHPFSPIAPALYGKRGPYNKH